MNMFDPALSVMDESSILSENTATVTYEDPQPRTMLQVQVENMRAYNEALIRRYKSYLNQPLTESVILKIEDNTRNVLDQIAANMESAIAFVESYKPSDASIASTIIGRKDIIRDALEGLEESYPYGYDRLCEIAEESEIKAIATFSIPVDEFAQATQNAINTITEMADKFNSALLTESGEKFDKIMSEVAEAAIDLKSTMSHSSQFHRISNNRTTSMNAYEYLFESDITDATYLSEKVDFTALKRSLADMHSILENEKIGEKLSNCSSYVKASLNLEDAMAKLATIIDSINESIDFNISKSAWQYNAIAESFVRIADGGSHRANYYSKLDTSYDLDRVFTEFFSDWDSIIDRMSLFTESVRSEAILKEASIMEDNSMTIHGKADAMQALNEAIGQKVKRAWNNTIQTLKTLFNKFMEKLRANFTTTKHYLDKYKNVILDKNFANNEYGTQDLKLGINRIIETTIPVMNFADAGNTQDGKHVLDNPVTYFNSKIKPGLKNVDSTKEPLPKDDGTLADIMAFWKSYFCMENHPIKITGPEFQKDVKFYYEFLYDVAKIERTCKKTLNDVEKSITTVMKQAGVDVGNVENNTTAQPAQQTTAEGVFYSYINSADMIFTEVEKLGPVGQNQNQPAQQPTTQAQTQTPAEKLQNVSGNRDDVKDEDNIKATQRNIMDARCTNYANNASAMMKAKMSACEFIRNECMQIIREHVKSYIGGTADGQDHTQDNNNKQEEQQPQEQPTGQTQDSFVQNIRKNRAAKKAARQARKEAKKAT